MSARTFDVDPNLTIAQLQAVAAARNMALVHRGLTFAFCRARRIPAGWRACFRIQHRPEVSK